MIDIPDVVKNVTRTVTEASATVKGLTGIDIPSLVGDAMGVRPSGVEPPRRGRRGTADGGGGGGSSTGGQSGGRGTRSQRPAGQPAGAASAGASTTPESSSAAVDEALARADRAIHDASATPPSTPSRSRQSRTDTAAGPARPATGTLASSEITADTTLDEAATRLASDLRAIPGIERFATVRLADLETGGPRPLRTMWRAMRDELDERYSKVTIGELIERFEQRQPPAS